MKMRTKLMVTTVLLAVLLAAAAVGQEIQDRPQDRPQDKPEGKTIRSVTGSPENPLTPVDHAFSFTSEEGDFRVIWPSGCSSVKTRTPGGRDDGGDPEREYPVMVFCDRFGEKGDGCSVTVVFNARSEGGGPVDPPEVMRRMKALLAGFGAEIKRQAPVNKTFADGRVAEGLDVAAAQTDGAGQVWVRGMIIDGVVYILSAWDLAGNVWNNPEYITFFNSFQPGTE
jgi:hypothetical protein